MTLVFSSFRIGSLKSFCATRQTLGGVLQGYVCVPSLGCGCITPPCVYSSFCLLNNQFILFPTAIQSLLINHFHVLNLIFKSILEVHKQIFICQKSKRAGRGGRGLDLEAKGWGAETGVFYFSRRSDSEGS